MSTYSIIRFVFNGDNELIAQGLTLEEAQAHCKDPETSSKTGKSSRVGILTERHGSWFDGYQEEEE